MFFFFLVTLLLGLGRVGSDDKNGSSSRALNESGEPVDSRVKWVELASYKRAGRVSNELDLNESNPRAPVELNRASRVCVAS
jgi:hypothetical protein